MYRWTESGERRHQVVIQQLGTPARQPDGSLLQTYTTFATPWAKISHLSGDEAQRMGITDARAFVRLNIPYRSGVTTSMYITVEGREFHITDVNDVLMMHREIEITAEERLRA